MRILFTFVGGRGHFDPLVPLARAAGAAGHTVAVTGQPAMVPHIQAAGFVAFATGPSASGTLERSPLLSLDAEREDRDLREGFARRAAQVRANDILALCAQWRPDVIVCDEVDFGSMVAAERLALPYASVLVIAAGSFVRSSVVAEPLQLLRAEHGLPPDPELTMLSRYLVLCPFPPSYRDPVFPLPATAYTFHARSLPLAGPETTPTWFARLPPAPCIYFTLGTVFNLESGDLFSRVIDGLRASPIDVVVTVGPHIDPAEFGPQPDHIHLERYIPQAFLLPRCKVMVSHGGSGSVMGALEHGVPMVLLPMGADQPLNAARCTELGVARVLDAVACSPDTVRETVEAVLADPAYRQSAERMRDEIAGLPSPADAITLLERLHHEKSVVR